MPSPGLVGGNGVVIVMTARAAGATCEKITRMSTWS
jgi:hypothetical protein